MQISCWRAAELLVGFVGDGGDGEDGGRLIIFSLKKVGMTRTILRRLAHVLMREVWARI